MAATEQDLMAADRMTVPLSDGFELGLDGRPCGLRVGAIAGKCENGLLQGRSGPFSRSALGGIRTTGRLIRSRQLLLRSSEYRRTERIARR
jgi:hypothetical protein